MTLDELENKIASRSYEPDFEYTKERRNEWRAVNAIKEQEFRKDLGSAAFPALTDEQSRRLVDYAWQEGHAYGLDTVLSQAVELAEVIEPIVIALVAK